MPGGTPVMSRALPGIDVVRAHGIRIRSLHGPPLREAAEAEGLDVHGLGATLDHELRHALAHRGGDLEPGATERGGEVKAVDAVHAPENRVAIGAVAVEGLVAAGERGALHDRDAVHEELGAQIGGASESPVPSVSGSMSHSWQGTPTRVSPPPSGRK